MNLFEIYFIRFGITDLVDIAIMAFIIYQLYKLMRGTIAFQIFIGILALYLMDVIVTATDMVMLRFLFGNVSEVFVLAIIILFQPEIRRLLVMVGQTPGFRRFMRPESQNELITEIIASVSHCSKMKIGALLVFTRNTPLGAIIETGTSLESKVERDLLISIFQSTSPLHDGAVIIQNQRIQAARCILPISQSMKLSPHLGLRHRAAVGLTEQNDAFVVIVSEETGFISISENGKLTTAISLQDLEKRLTIALMGENSLEKPKPSSTPDNIPEVETVI